MKSKKSKDLIAVKRRLAKKGIENVRMKIDCPSTSEPHGNFPVQVSRPSGDILMTLSFRVRPDDMRAIDHAIEILKELKESE